MRLINKLLIIASALILTGLALLLSVSHVFESSARLNEALNKAGVYEALSKTVQNNFQQNLTQAGVDDPIVMKSVERVITPEHIQKVLQPTIISLVNWLKSPPGSTELPKTTIELTTIKSDLNAQFSKDLDRTKADIINFEVTKAIPDTLSLTPAAQLANGDGTQTSVQSGGNDNNKTLASLKANYDKAKSWFIPMLISALAITALQVVFNLRRGRAKLTKIAWSFLIAGLMVAGLSYGAPLLANNVGSGQDTSKVLTGLTPVLLEDAKIYGLIYLIVALVAAAIAFIFIKPADKKSRKR